MFLSQEWGLQNLHDTKGRDDFEVDAEKHFKDRIDDIFEQLSALRRKFSESYLIVKQR